MHNTVCKAVKLWKENKCTNKWILEQSDTWIQSIVLHWWNRLTLLEKKYKAKEYRTSSLQKRGQIAHDKYLYWGMKMRIWWHSPPSAKNKYKGFCKTLVSPHWTFQATSEVWRATQLTTATKHLPLNLCSSSDHRCLIRARGARQGPCGTGCPDYSLRPPGCWLCSLHPQTGPGCGGGSWWLWRPSGPGTPAAGSPYSLVGRLGTGAWTCLPGFSCARQ